MHGCIRKRILLGLNALKMKKKLIIMYFGVFFVPMIVILLFLSYKVYITLSSWEKTQAEQNLIQVENYVNSVLGNAGELSDRLYVNEVISRIVNTNYLESRYVYEDYINLAFLDDY